MAPGEQRTGVIGMGYEGQDLNTFIEKVLANGVSTVVDVRLNPISRKRGFSKRAFAAALAEHGVGYLHARELGNPKWNRPGFGGSASELSAARAIFADQISAPICLAQLDEIAKSAATGLAAVVCFEADERRCHRYVVLDRLRTRLAELVPAH
ncbi:DUF488 domain-containing protein [Actinoallomurus spadix]|uniref:DUF488 domain-containing protein n=1 Tax=Actinoallomurus spadix TaxID=79912 RepID=A0ABP3HC59_9ACTN|nr:DUF488 domain-containing protein [Actinoallomurus spadix]MCO5984969.1 DUF488 domain-containing protein [Actinoallomurus spadix]